VERLFGFSDDYTKIADHPEDTRISALGNSIAVPVLTWIGRRITQVEAHEQVHR
jgi:DNA (cytosine-5)-methyltransferase 1